MKIKFIKYLYLACLLFSTNAYAQAYSVVGSHTDYIELAEITTEDDYIRTMDNFRSKAKFSAERQCAGYVNKVSDWRTKHDRSGGCGYCTLIKFTVEANYLCIPAF